MSESPSVLVVGSVALDTVETPRGLYPDTLGGSAVHFAMAARHFARVRLLGVVGEDFPEAHLRLLDQAGIDLAGLERRPGKTFRWSGKYAEDMNSRETLSVSLNVFADFQPVIPEAWRESRLVFLANGAPATQLAVLDQLACDAFVMADTMDLWIRTAWEELVALIGRLQGLALNDSEARLLTGEGNLIAAGRKVQAMGPEVVLLKRGEHGATLFAGKSVVPVPAYPTELVVDPTGAGDSFAGGFMGALAEQGERTLPALHRAVLLGTAAASLNVEAPSVDRLARADRALLEARYQALRAMLRPE